MKSLACHSYLIICHCSLLNYDLSYPFNLVLLSFFPGTTKIKNLEDNIGSFKVNLTEADVKEISDAVPVDEVAGPRSYQSMYLNTWKFANTPPKDGKNSAQDGTCEEV